MKMLKYLSNWAIFNEHQIFRKIEPNQNLGGTACILQQPTGYKLHTQTSIYHHKQRQSCLCRPVLFFFYSLISIFTRAISKDRWNIFRCIEMSIYNLPSAIVLPTIHLQLQTEIRLFTHPRSIVCNHATLISISLDQRVHFSYKVIIRTISLVIQILCTVQYITNAF